MDKNNNVTPEMLEAGIREYLRPYSEEDDPSLVVMAIYQAMQKAQPVLDGCELKVMPLFATLIIHHGVAHVTSPDVGKLPDGEYPLSVHQKYHTATDVERGISEWREGHNKSKPQEEKL